MYQKEINRIHNSIKLWIKNNDDLATIESFIYTNSIQNAIRYITIDIKSDHLDGYLIEYEKIFKLDGVSSVKYKVDYAKKQIKFIILLKD